MENIPSQAVIAQLTPSVFVNFTWRNKMSLIKRNNCKPTKSLVVEVVNHQHSPIRFRRLLSSVLLLLTILAFSIGCTAAIDNDQFEVAASTPADVEPVLTEITLPTSTPISIPLLSPTVPATPTAAAIPETPTAEPEPTTASNEPVNWDGQQLITLREDGFYRLDLATDELELIASKVYREDEWQLSSGRISYDGKKVVYWFPEGDEFQVWLVNTVDEGSQLILNIANDNFIRADGEWHGQDRFFELGIRGEWEHGVPMMVQWYLFDTLEVKIIEMAIDRPGVRICHTIAVSPDSNQVATWCSFDSQFEEQRQHFVIEIDGSSWQTTATPEQSLALIYGLGEQIWSLDRSVLLIPGRNPTVVNILERSTYQLFDESDYDATTYNSRLSPDGRLWGYGYQLCGGSISFCTRVMDIESRTILWESSDLEAYIVSWSPDGKFLVVNTLEEGFIIRVSDFSVVKTLPTGSILSVETVWLDN
jgi:hypothetical protein